MTDSQIVEVIAIQVSKLELKPGDVLILRPKRPLEDAMFLRMNSICKDFRAMHGLSFPILLLDSDLEPIVVQQPDPKELFDLIMIEARRRGITIGGQT